MKRRLYLTTLNAAPARRKLRKSLVERIDPTRTGTVRRAFARKLHAQFAQLRGELFAFVRTLGLAKRGPVKLADNAVGKLGVAYVPVRDMHVRRRLAQLQADLDPADVVKLELDPHVTVLYGFFGAPTDPLEVGKLFRRPVTMRLGPLSVFRQPDADVLKVDVESSDLLQLNRLLQQVPSLQTYEYTPHLTVAYMKPGTARAARSGLEGDELVSSELVYSSPSRETFALTADAFSGATTNAADLEFASSAEKLAEFEKWLRGKFSVAVAGKSQKQLWDAYINDGFKRGAGKAWDSTKVSPAEPETREADLFEGSRKDFLAHTLRAPEAVEKVKLVASRTFAEVEGVTDLARVRMGRALADGLATGKNPRQVADELEAELDLGLARAETIARTEFIRAHAEGQLAAFEELGITQLGVEVEWATAAGVGATPEEMDAVGVCPQCQDMAGKTFAVEQSHGLIPAHPNCRCAFVPASKDFPTTNSRPPRRAWHYPWRKDYDTYNVFCPTGEGGGVDPSCSPGGAGAGDKFKDSLGKEVGIVSGPDEGGFYTTDSPLHGDVHEDVLTTWTKVEQSQSLETNPPAGVESTKQVATLQTKMAEAAKSHGFTKVHIQKLAVLNPDGAQDGVFKVDCYTSDKAKNEAKLQFFKEHLPPGTVIKHVSITKKDIQAAATKELQTDVGTSKMGGSPFVVESKPSVTIGDIAKPLPSTYAGLEAGHKYVNSVGAVKEVASVTHIEDKVKLTFKGEPGEAFIDPKTPFLGKPLGSSAFTPSSFTSPAPSTPEAAYVPSFQGKVVPYGEKAKAAAEAAQAKYTKGLKGEEKSAVTSYTGSGYVSLNTAMRSCPPDFGCVKGETAKKMERIQSAIDKAPSFEKPVHVRRGMQLSGPAAEKLANALEATKEGDGDFQFPSFTSTSTTSSWGGNVKFNIATKRGLYVRPISQHKHEDEVIVSPKQKFKVRAVTKKGGTYIVDLEES